MSGDLGKVSIIVPVYNVEKYLSKCIDSILAQTFKDFELILIDDGSPDDCGKIIDEYAGKDNRIVVVHQENAGVSAARNAGLKIARGTYIGFVDPDDYIDSEMYATMISKIKETGADIACCAFDRISENDETIRNNNADFSGELSRFEFLRHLFDAPRTILGGNCNKLFYREMTSKYDEQLTMCEDYVFLLDYSNNMSKAFFINKPFYHYRERAGSVDSYTSNYTIAADARLSLISLIANIDLELRKYAEKREGTNSHRAKKREGDSVSASLRSAQN